MNPVSGSGPTLREASSYLRDDAKCIARILDVSERNSMIEVDRQPGGASLSLH